MQVTLLQYYGDKAYSFGGNCPGAPHAIRPGKLVFLKDRLSGALFLADTGATGALRPLLPLLCSPEGFNHIFTIVDHSSRGLEATPLASTGTEIISAAFNSSLVARALGWDGPSHIRLRPSILLGPLVGTVAALGHLSPPHHHVSPAGQRDGLEGPPPAQKRLVGPHRRRRLGVTPPLGAVSSTSGPQSGFQPFCC